MPNRQHSENGCLVIVFEDLTDIRERTSASCVVNDEWRDPSDYLKLLQGVPHQKLRVGPFRLGCRADSQTQILRVLTVKKRGGEACRSDD